MLPDEKQRNELKFKILPGVPYKTRAWIVFGLWFCGFGAQALGYFWPGVAMVFAGTLMALTRGYSNEPATRRPRGKKRWENVRLEEFHRIAKLDEESKRWDRSAWIDLTNAYGCFFGVLAIGVILFASFLLTAVSFEVGRVCLANGLAIFFPFWVTGIRRLYHRTELMIRVRALENIVRLLEKPGLEGLMPTPMLELQKTRQGDLPRDVKLMVRHNDAPEKFMGIQVQVSLNDVQGTKYPYLYCVILARPGFGLRNWDSRPSPRFGKILVEPKSTHEVELLVVRQKTTKTSGYHTKPAAQIRVFEAAADICQRNLAKRS
jgi:hypothetical protein